MDKLRAYELCPITALRPYTNNPRKHSTNQIQQIANSIRQFGWIAPIIVDEQREVLAGHGRVLAAQQLGLTQVPIILVDDLTEAEKRAYRLADNKLTENAGWDQNLLKVELTFLMDPEVDFDVDLTGFTTPEIDACLGLGESAEQDPEGGAPLPDMPAAGDTVSQRGDLWVLGPHHILCADCRHSSELERLMAGERAAMVITDPPYNVPVNGHVSSTGAFAEFADADGSMSPEAFTGYLKVSLGQLADVSVPGSLHYVFMDWRHLPELLAAGSQVYSDLLNLCVWVKNNGGMGSFYRSQHELVLIYKLGKETHTNNVQLGKYGRYRTNVWSYAGVNAFGPDREEALAMHPTVKPAQMIADAILDASAPGDIIVDGFLGSGTTVIAAQLTRRRGFGIEIDPRYVDVAVQRWQNLTQQAAIHAASGLSFEQERQARIEITEEPDDDQG